MNKYFDWGLDLMVGYAYTNAKDVSPLPSFTASTSWSNVATSDIGNVKAATSNYETRNRVTLRASFAREFWGDNTTRITLMGYYKSGQPNTYTMDSDDGLLGGYFGSSLLYVPDGPSDTNVVYTDDFDQAEFFAWIDKKGLKPGFTKRNQLDSRTSNRLDLRIDQEIPLGLDSLKARAFLKIYNFSNMLNKDWGRQNDAKFFSTNVVALSEYDSFDADPESTRPIINGAFNYANFSESSLTDLQEFPSMWEMRLGLEINFN